MFLKALTLKGFKSFADTTTMELEPGVTVVVGPNGSGKSNVVDAIAWVLGAQAPSAVRSQKMDDVIFAGTARRPALGRAEVTLTLDNADGQLGIDFTEVTVTRTLFRSGESEYALNGVQCRLLDIQELLSDAGVGRQQHVIISQGQIDAVLNARPEDRRQIIEEASGVLKHRKRKEKAERRLEATEGSLLRAQDLLREVRRQLRPLERQAESARRHDAIARELRELQLYVWGRDIESLQSRIGALEAEGVSGAEDERMLREQVAEIEGVVSQLEGELARGGESHVGDELVRVEQLLGRARGQIAVIAERRRSVENDRYQLMAEGVVASLDGEVQINREEVERVEREIEKAETQDAVLASEEASLVRDRASSAQAVAEATDAAQRALDAASETHTGALSALAAERARAEMLEASMVATTASATRAAEVPGALGVLEELIEIDEEWRPAVQAALADALSAAVLADPASARAALEHLRASQGMGAVVALGAWTSEAAPIVIDAPAPKGAKRRRAARAAKAREARGLARLIRKIFRREDVAVAVVAPATTPEAATTIEAAPTVEMARPAWPEHSLRPRVRARSGEHQAAVSVLLDALLSRVVYAEDFGVAVDLAFSRPDAIVVTRAGDRLAMSAMRVGPGAVTGEALARARDRVAAAEAAAEAARVALHQRRGALEAMRAASAGADATPTDLALRTASLAEQRRDMDSRIAALRERREVLLARIAEIESRLAADSEERAAASERRSRVDARLGALGRLARVVEGHVETLERRRRELQDERQRQSQEVREITGRLDATRKERGLAAQQLEARRERNRKVEVEMGEARVRLESAVETLKRELEVDAHRAVAAPQPVIPEGTTAQERMRELERELRLMGPINPLALEEFTELQERNAFLEKELEDVKETRRELQKVIRQIDQEIQSTFASAYADVTENFAKLFGMLFPGGTGRLTLTNPDDLLMTGIEVEAKPSGKNVKKLSLLSGGERSLTALAFLFAVFRSRPSPFYVMDEVEAALDDVNLHRFLALVAEFRRDAQLLIVSHQKRTMEAGDSLLGVTMQPGGSSRVVVERVVAKSA
ncbi:MAG: chromosome segregation SMC family protein [Acidimicrobiia bacterium]